MDAGDGASIIVQKRNPCAMINTLFVDGILKITRLGLALEGGVRAKCGWCGSKVGCRWCWPRGYLNLGPDRALGATKNAVGIWCLSNRILTCQRGRVGRGFMVNI